MRRACCDCAYLSTYGGSVKGGTVDCKMHPRKQVANPFEHVCSYVCDKFAPWFIANPEPRAHAALLSAQHYGSPILKKALDRWFAGPPNDVNVSTNRSLPMLSVAENNLATFESDEELKSYRNSNHIFADFFGGVKVKWPLLFFLSRSNKPGVRVEILGNSEVAVLYLGAPYSFAEVTAAISYVLGCQNMKLIRPWFLRHLRSLGIDPSDPSFGSFIWLTPELNDALAQNKNKLRGSRTIIAIGDSRADEGAIAEALGYNYNEYATLWCDADREFHLHYLDSTVRNFSTPSEISNRLSETNKEVFLLSPRRYDDLWARIPERAFDSIKAVIVIVEPDNLSWIASLDAFKNFSMLDFRRDDLIGKE